MLNRVRKEKIKNRKKGSTRFFERVGSDFLFFVFFFFRSLLFAGDKNMCSTFAFAQKTFFFWKTKRERKRDKETKTKNEYERKKTLEHFFEFHVTREKF